jgi:hypothetical protein
VLVDVAYRLRERLTLRLHAIAYDNESLHETVPFDAQVLSCRAAGRVALSGVTGPCSAVCDSQPGTFELVGSLDLSIAFLGLNYATEPFPVFR